jgi:hypothetical protein
VTLLPVEPVRVTIPAQDGWVEEDLPALCCNPQCDRRGGQTHHVVRRSETGGPIRWVAIDGVILLNEWRICLWCHEMLNCHDAWIRYLTPFGWVWYAALPARRSPVAGHGGPDFIQHPKSGRWFRLIGPLRRR